jgi:hypothetical protein
VRCTRGRREVTPSSTQERGVWRECQSQHNRKYNWSKHVMFGSVKRQEGRQRSSTSRSQKQASFRSFNMLLGWDCGAEILQRVFNY